MRLFLFSSRAAAEEKAIKEAVGKTTSAGWEDPPLLLNIQAPVPLSNM